MTLPSDEYLCGMGAGLISVLITFPINKLMFRQSVWGFDFLTAIRQLKIEGFRFLYRGVGPTIIIKPLMSSIMFGSYHQYYRMISKENRYHLGYSIVASLLSGTTEALFATPFERIQVILQDGRFNQQYANMFDATYKLKKFGLLEYYRGLNATILRNCPSTFLYFSGLEYLQNLWFINLEKRQHLLSRFVCGAVLGASISSIAYPLNVIKTRMQMQTVGSRLISIPEAFELSLLDRRTFFVGIHINLLRSLLYWGCITVTSDLLRIKLINQDRTNSI